jgi:uncharacterized glyoxalase superfamily protein PhnB
MQCAFDSLAAGGSVPMPLGRLLFSPCFRMVADRGGVSRRLLVEP